MNNGRNYNYSYLTLALAGVALIVTLLAWFAKLAIGNGFLLSFNPDTVDLTLQISGMITVISAAAYAFMEPDAVRDFMGTRQARYGANLTVMTLAFVGIIIFANSIVYSADNPLKLDLTESKENTLSPELTRALDTLPAKLTATAFFSSQASDIEARKLLQSMKASAGGKFDYSFVNPDANPVAAKAAGVTGDGKIALEMNGRTEVADYADEGEILLAIVRILNPENRTVYFLIGHGEADIEGNGDRTMTRAKETLESKNYTVKTLNLLAENKIPADAKAIIIAGPTKPVSANEVSLLVNYALHGGALIVMEDPTAINDFGDAIDPLANSLSQIWGLRLRNDFVVDTANTSNVGDVIGTNMDFNHPITRTMNPTLPPIMHLARSIEILPREGVTQSALVQTSLGYRSWGETDFTPLKDPSAALAFDEGTDAAGPVVVAAAIENANGLGRVVVIGNSFFADDQGFDVYGNGDFFVNSVDWAVGQEDTIGLTPKPQIPRTLKLPSANVLLLIQAGLLCLIPGLILGLGVYAWAVRRKRG